MTRNLTKSMDTLFPQPDGDECRVCGEVVVDGRWSYCSVRCREVAQGVQRMFVWDHVRDRVLRRDDHTCQRCGLSREMANRAHWTIYNRIKELTEHLRDNDDYDAWREEQRRLEEAYNMPLQVTLEADHIQRIADEGHPFDARNLETLCAECHREKTADENSGSTRGEQSLGLDAFLDESEADAEPDGLAKGEQLHAEATDE